MTSKAARGFLMLSLNSEQIQKIRAKEISYPPGRFLAPWEISTLLSMKTGTKDEGQVMAMEKLEETFRRTLWKNRKLEEVENAIIVLSDKEEMHSWDDYVIANWDYSTNIGQNDY